MQPAGPVEDQEGAREDWLWGRDQAILTAEKLLARGIAKQYVNRVLEPWAKITVVVTSTDYQNWFGLRYHAAAQNEIAILAKTMWEKYSTMRPVKLSPGEWHLPFVGDDEIDALDYPWEIMDDLMEKSVACCARVSYLNHDKENPTAEENSKLYERLLGSQPIHASPAEHQAMAAGDVNVRSGNFTGWIQYRKTIPHECIKKFEKPTSLKTANENEIHVRQCVPSRSTSSS